MGLCFSCDAGDSTATAKVVLQDGRLQEYSYPVKASDVIQRDSGCFLCNSDEMEFDDALSAVDADDELQPGQIYFALPLSFLRRPLQPQEMAALAVKASAALVKCSGGDKRSKIVIAPVGEKDLRSARRKEAGRGGRMGRSIARRNKVFTANLDAIEE